LTRQLQLGATFLPTQDTTADPIGDGPRRASDPPIARRHFRRGVQRSRKRVTDLTITRERLVWRLG